MFCDGSIETLLLVDQGSDINLLTSAIFKYIQNADSQVRINQLDSPHKYSGIATAAAGDASTHCTQQLIIDVQLQFRHGFTLILRSID